MQTAYLKKFAAALLLLPAAVAALCWKVDPYAIFHPARLDPPAAYAADLLYYLRTTKAYQLEYLHADALIFGSSRASTLPPAALARTHEVAYNAALPGALSYEIWRYARHAIAVKTPARIVVGLDYEAFLVDNGRFLPGFEERRLAAGPGDLGPLRSLLRHYPDYWSALASAGATTRVLDVLRQHKGSTVFYSDGTWAERGDRGQLLLIGQAGYDFMTRQQFARSGAARPVYDLQYLQALLDECHRRHIEAIFYISPVHHLVGTVYQYAHHDAARRQWQRDVARLIEDSARRHDAAPFALWGFEDNATVADDPARGAGAGPVFRDGMHFSFDYGSAIIRQIAHGDGDLGSRLTVATVDAYLDRTAGGLAAYQQQHPEQIAQLRRNLGL